VPRNATTRADDDDAAKDLSHHGDHTKRGRSRMGIVARLKSQVADSSSPTATNFCASPRGRGFLHFIVTR
jgi:hypothetical protein